MSAPRLTPMELHRKAIALLTREFGAADTIRFINLYSNGHGDYTEERRELFAGVTLEQLLADIHAGKANTPPPGAEVVAQPPA